MRRVGVLASSRMVLTVLGNPTVHHSPRSLAGGVLSPLQRDRIEEAPAALVEACLLQQPAMNPLPDCAGLDSAELSSLLGVYETVVPGDAHADRPLPPEMQKCPAPEMSTGVRACLACRDRCYR